MSNLSNAYKCARTSSMVKTYGKGGVGSIQDRKIDSAMLSSLKTMSTRPGLAGMVLTRANQLLDEVRGTNLEHRVIEIIRASQKSMAGAY